MDFFDGDDSDDEYYMLYVASEATDAAKPKMKAGGSVKGKCPNKDRSREAYGKMLMRDYFDDDCTDDAAEFRRRFRMRRSLFQRIVRDLVQDDASNYFVQKPDATGELGFLPEQKVTVAMRMLAYGSSADQMDELVRMAESTALETLKIFCSSVIRLYGEEYLRAPSVDDLNALLAENAARGFPGMIGSLDCMHWT